MRVKTRNNNMVGGDMPLSEFIDQLREILQGRKKGVT